MPRKLIKWAPIAGILTAFYSVYSTKKNGFMQVITDLENLSLDKIQAKMSNVIIAVIAAIAISVVLKYKMEPWMKLLAAFILYYILATNIFKVVDPVDAGQGVANTTQLAAYGIQPAFR
jgi:hypothetical protein